jgi:hypothetical protein
MRTRKGPDGLLPTHDIQCAFLSLRSGILFTM